MVFVKALCPMVKGGVRYAAQGKTHAHPSVRTPRPIRNILLIVTAIWVVASLIAGAYLLSIEDVAAVWEILVGVALLIGPGGLILTLLIGAP